MNDAEIRARLHAHFDREGSPWVDEVTTTDCRVDMLALVGGVLTGIEIKSGKDTLKRLDRQIANFERRFRQVLVVTEARHAPKVKAAVPGHCGIWVAEETPTGVFLRTRSRALGTRRPQPRGRGNPMRLLWLLRRAELVTALGEDPAGPLTKRAAAELLRAERSVDAVERLVLDALVARKGAAGKGHLAAGG